MHPQTRLSSTLRTGNSTLPLTTLSPPPPRTSSLSIAGRPTSRSISILRAGVCASTDSAADGEPELLEKPKRPPPRATRAPSTGGRARFGGNGGGQNRGDRNNGRGGQGGQGGQGGRGGGSGRSFGSRQLESPPTPAGGGPQGDQSFGGVPSSGSQGGRGGRKSFNKNDKGHNGPGRGRGGDGPRGGNSRGQEGNRRGQQKINLAGRRKARQNRKAERKQEALAAAPVREEIFEVGPEGMSVPDLAEMLAVPAVDIVKKLFMKGLAVQVNSTLDSETVKLVGEEYGVDVLDIEESVEDSAKKSRDFIDEDDIDSLQSRPPVVTVMGHVDHGKTSLLDYIRKAKVAAGEAGGITQSIGAYTCTVDSAEGSKAVTFLDTPGHEAFSAMRARGARVTDLAIIIVAADDGVRPQTLEAISHAKAAGVPIVVAINKMDKEGANPDRVKQELTEVELIPEEWGGKTPMVNISAKKGTGVDELLETVLLVAELEELVANPDRHATGTVLEACLDRKSGPITTLIVQNGHLKVGDCIAAGAAFGKVRSLKTSSGDVSEIGPSLAAQVLGLSSVPQAGDEFEVFESETRARQAAEAVEDARRLERLSEMAGGGSMVTLSSLASMDDESEDQVLQRMNIILKADASGSCEAVKAALAALPQDTVMLRYLMSAPGDITASDIDLAIASGGMILGFNVQPSEAVAAEAKKNNVTLRTYSVIYDIVDEVRAAMEGRLKTVEEKVKIGEAEVKAVFGSGSRKAAGCLVTDGILSKNAVVVVRRKKKVLYEGQLSSLRRVKDDVKEVPSGTECGVAVDGFKDWAEDDVIECYQLVEKRLKLEEAHAPTIEI